MTTTQELRRLATIIQSTEVDPVAPAIAAARDALSSYDMLCRMTTFSQWYKGEHGQTRTALMRALKALISVLKENNQSTDEVKAYLDSVRAKASGDVPEMLKK